MWGRCGTAMWQGDPNAGLNGPLSAGAALPQVPWPGCFLTALLPALSRELEQAFGGTQEPQGAGAPHLSPCLMHGFCSACLLSLLNQSKTCPSHHPPVFVPTLNVMSGPGLTQLGNCCLAAHSLPTTGPLAIVLPLPSI